MNSLFGVELPAPVNFIIAFIVVLALIGAATWLVRRFGATRLDAAARGRQPRLAVIDTAAVDGRRKLIMIRRDNVEHLVMIGGPNDVVVEASIVRGAATAGRDTPAARTTTEPLPRALPLADTSIWPEPVAAPTVRVDRERPRVVADEPRVTVAPEPRVTIAAEPPQWPPTQPDQQPEAPPIAARAPRTAVDPLAGLAAELSRAAPEPPRATPELSRPTPASVAARQVQPAPIEPSVAAADKSLADMAQRLELALRQPAPPTAPGDNKTPARPVVDAKRAEPAWPTPRPDAKPEPKSEPKSEPQPEPKSETKPAATAAPPTAPIAPAPLPPVTAKSQFDSIEEEMASLLGRPGKT